MKQNNFFNKLKSVFILFFGLMFGLVVAQNSSIFFQPQAGSIQKLVIEKATGDSYVSFGGPNGAGVMKLNPSGVDQGAVVNESASFITIDENSNLYYVVVNYTNVTSTVKKVDMQNINNPTTIFTKQGTSQSGMFINGNRFYYSDQSTMSINYVDISGQTPSAPTTLYSGGSFIPGALYVQGGFLYATMSGGSPGNSKIIKIDLANPGAGSVDVVLGLTNLGFLAVDNLGKIYYTSKNASNIIVLNRYTPSLGTSDTIDDGSNGNFLALDVDANGNVFFTAYNPNNGNPFSALYKISAASLSTKKLTAKAFSVYPNPAKDFVTISNVVKGAEVSLFDMSGKLLYSTKATGTTLTINTSSYKNGVYMLKVDGQTTKLLISK